MNEWSLLDLDTSWVGEAKRMLATFRIDADDLRDKQVLELGAARCVIGHYCKMLGIDCLSIDRETYEGVTDVIKDEIEMGKQNVPYVRADAASLPLRDESVDFILSYEGPPAMGVRSHAELRSVCNEVRRVLKKDGVFLLAPPLLAGKYYLPQRLTEAQKNTIIQRWGDRYYKRMRQKSVDFLLGVLPDAQIDLVRETCRYEYLRWQKKN